MNDSTKTGGSQATPAGQGAGRTPARLRVMSFAGAGNLPLLAAETQGFFAAEGLAVEIAWTPDSPGLRRALAAGEIDVAHAAVDNAIAMVETDGVDVVVVAGLDDGMNELVVQPDVSDIADLMGRTVIVDAPNTAFALQLRKILALTGLTAGVHYHLRSVGATDRRVAAMIEDKSFAATLLSPSYADIAARGGLKRLGPVSRWIGPYQGIGVFALRRFAAAERPKLVAYLRGLLAGLAWTFDPANRDTAIALLVARVKMDPAAAAAGYDQAVHPVTGLFRDARVNAEGMATVLALRAELEGGWNGVPPPASRYVDDSFLVAARAGLRL
ncbi:ABC transporter substrate-binding protein [Phreatobacter stygius]|uniref:ABC transporter substrate-binding protein n=1 Tax=Phreatobacter stygius TaxID=1940610 RepID=A0A4D7BH58_9HYPH|nr:ABC transporter substrate-binding protein [Phreatobacter stygius]QCI67137.1 ABC transporter substrate-binding protein [Phreatobacter stygius]